MFVILEDNLLKFLNRIKLPVFSFLNKIISLLYSGIQNFEEQCQYVGLSSLFVFLAYVALAETTKILVALAMEKFEIYIAY